MDTFVDVFSQCQQWLFETVVQPAMFHLGLSNLIEDGFDATMWLLAGLVQIAIMVAVFAPLQRWRPAEALHDHASVRVDVLYTAIHTLGLFRVFLFFTTEPLADALFGRLHVLGIEELQLDGLWPGVTDVAWVSLLIYLLVFDLIDYLFHRAEHRFEWMWALHAVHHSQRQMTLWSDNRNHLLSDLMRDTVVVAVSHLIGVPPGQFVAVVILGRLVESFSHANVRLAFGRLGQRLLVGPRFHRHHHAIAESHAPGQAPARPYGCNFAVLFPIWDILFRTADFHGDYGPTGIVDQQPDRGGRDYGRSFLSQQWLGILRLLGRG
ncbi:sterol desaturase family protein [Pigmentiphaga soli]|uniref:Sterol desaturase family protein n=1 Tax=Pigmentiphaga soli TaxID=1007095 RepID=A0ABP8H7U9_9BURK